MRMVDLIAAKKHGKELAAEEISWMVGEYVAGRVPDYQMSAFLMAVCFKGMSDAETAQLTQAVAASGDQIDLSSIAGVTADKHSTGGVGDKTTLIVAPIAAACGLKVAKMSGRGLGHTGGTVDKLDSIPGFRTTLPEDEFFAQVERCGLAVIGQSANLAPADKKLYALRDVTATVDSVPLIAASIMSKKLAAGSQCIVLDVKTGSGAFMKTLDDSILLAEKMVAIGLHNGRKISALVTDMDRPLGFAIGNSAEVIEAIETLKNKGPADLSAVSLQLAAELLCLAGLGRYESCFAKAKQTLTDGSALAKLREMIAAQGGDTGVVDDYTRFKAARFRLELLAPQAGYLTHMDTEGIGLSACLLGAGRTTLDSRIDYSAAIVLRKKTGDRLAAGECVAELYADDEALFAPSARAFNAAYTIGAKAPAPTRLVLAKLSHGGVERY